ncbi:kinase-like domain-containing protein [Lentinula aciculospora]|uniref:Kinase-like domain-containing protein n=1 Tax=Lentinula aciculospora TaxID=153920 RepID=A0A9W9AJP8_9AGAR|nr:kinase-like domain-containing protein [Lentinula aciculospora]
MLVDPTPPPPRRPHGLRRVRGPADLQPRLDVAPSGHRMASDGSYLSPLQHLTTNILDTYRICNPQFRYESTHNPRRVLTKPSKPAHNEGYDNDDYDYILYVNDWLGTEEGHKYLILDILGQGTFGQVVKCQNMKTHEIVAVKVVKNKPAYFNQSMMEVTILELLNKQCDPSDTHHILRLRDSFIHRNHLCLVFELLSSNLYELIKQNQFQGLSTQLVKVFMAQLLDALTVLKEARLIHCDLKPENILLKSLQSPQIKVIDFGSACHERQTVYTYIQSRFYRSPEVLLGLTYTAAIDMWSLGCIAVELFLGLPLFPGTSEYNQICRIVDMLGVPPLSMLNIGKQSSQFFDSFDVWNPLTGQNEKKWKLKSLEQYSRDHGTNEQPGKQYFKASSLPEIINTAPMPASKSSSSSPNANASRQHEIEKEMNNRAAFIDFCQGLLDMNPVTRWTPQQARLHPFITGEKFVRPFLATAAVAGGSSPSSNPNSSPANSSDPKRPYGGLVPSQPKGTRAYQDAATYNQHLAQHQVYTAQAQAQAQQQREYRNPYLTPGSTGQTQSQQPASQVPSHDGYGLPANPAQLTQPPPPVHHRLTHQTSTGHLNMNSSSSMPQFPGTGSGVAGPNSYYPSNSIQSSSQQSPASSTSSRGRANTITQMDAAIPPALARLQHMNQDVIQGRNALTPVLNRDDAMREWERRQSGKGGPPPPGAYSRELEYLQQQAELAASGGAGGQWGGNGAGMSGMFPSIGRYHAGHTQAPSKLSHGYSANVPPILVDDSESASASNAAGNARRDAIMSNVRSAARGDGPGAALYGGAGGVISSPPQAYTGGTPTSGNRYALAYSSQPPSQLTGGPPSSSHPSSLQPQHNSPQTSFESVDRRADIGNMYGHMQTDVSGPGGYGPPSGSYSNHGSSTVLNAARHIAPPGQSVAPSFYGAGVTGALPPMVGTQSMPGSLGPVNSQQQRPIFGEISSSSGSLKDSRRASGMDAWPR